jgi:uncharacterized protein (TIGR03435 family)
MTCERRHLEKRNRPELLQTIIAVITALALTSAGTLAGSAQSQSAATPASPSFEAASIKALAFDSREPIDFRFFPNRVVATNVTLGQLIEQAYGIESRELTGGPGWLRTDHFNVMATAGESVDRERMKLMLQALLADRFQLQIARETTAGTVYTLTARNVHDLKPPANPSDRSRVSTVREDRSGFLSYHYDGHNADMAALAQVLSEQLRAPVVDQTNVIGNYDFRINFAYDSAFGGLEPDPNVPTILTAIETQIGLKLAAGKGPVPVYAIIRATKPSPN